MSENSIPNPQYQEESFASRTKVILELHSSLLQSTKNRLDEIKGYFLYVRKPVWEKILDLRITGVILLVISISTKFLPTLNNDQILETSEFITIFIVGTLLLILGTYFNSKELQEGRKVIEKENETLATTATAMIGLMNH